MRISLKRFKPINFILYSASFVIAVFGIALIYALISPVDVLKDWKLTVPQAQYTAGDTLYLESSYEKVRKISGEANRYLQCKKPDGKSWDGFILLSQANANRPQASTANAVTALALPVSVANLPNTCRIYINVDYEVNSFRNFTEQTYSNTFLLVPKEQGTAPNTNTNPSTSVAPNGTAISYTDESGKESTFTQPDTANNGAVVVTSTPTSPTQPSRTTLPQRTTQFLNGILTSTTDGLYQLIRR